MRCIIVDDDELSIAHMQHLCKRIEGLDVIKSFNNALPAYQFMQDNQIDLVFLDIEMPDFSGIDLAKNLQTSPAIIFISAKERYAIEAFDFIETVIDYIIKPVTLPRLLKAIRRYNKADITTTTQQPPGSATELVTPPSATTSDFIFVKADRKYVRIDLSELLYIETVGDYSIFKTETSQFVVHATLKSIGERLSHAHFFKVHRSFIVNISKIKDIEDSNLLIADKIIPISRANRSDLMELIAPL